MGKSLQQAAMAEMEDASAVEELPQDK